MTRRSVIAGCGAYLPQRVMTNDELSSFIETTDEWINERTGIRQRHIAADNELTSDLGAQAAREALQNAGLKASDIDVIVLATTTPDDTFPATAVAIQHKIGATRAFSFDIQAVCAGFIYALSVADNFIKAGQAKTALVIGAEVMTRLLDWQDRKSCILFGDGAGAVVLQASEDPARGILSTHLYAEGGHRDYLYVEGRAGKIQMQGREVFRHAVEKMGQSVRDGLAANNLKTEQIDWFVPHQANQRIIDAMATRFEIPTHKLILSVAQHANTSAASIPLAFASASDKIRPGDLIVATAIGGGFTWGSAVLRW